METPRGYNPIGQSAPGLPRHDAPLPGHVPGSFQNIGGGADSSPPMPTGSDILIPRWLRVWIGRGIYFFTVYLSMPVQAGLYPIAGVGGVIAAGVTYGFMRVTGSTLDAREGAAWMACFLIFLPLMRLETNYESSNPAYPVIRHWIRLGLGFIGMTYFGIHEQHNALGSAVVVAAVATVLLHFVLKWKFLRGMWHLFQMESWVRRKDTPTP